MNESTQSSFVEFLKGLLLVILQVLMLPYRLILSSFESLGKWGRNGKLPSTDSEFPVITFITIDLKPFAIIFVCVMAILLAIPSFGSSLIVGYLLLPLVAYWFEILAMFVAAVNSLKKIERK